MGVAIDPPITDHPSIDADLDLGRGAVLPVAEAQTQAVDLAAIPGRRVEGRPGSLELVESTEGHGRGV